MITANGAMPINDSQLLTKQLKLFWQIPRI